MRRAALILLLPLFAAGCAGWFGEAEDPPLPGERVAVLTLDRSLKPDPRLARRKVRLPQQVRNQDWPQPGGRPDHAMRHLEVSSDISARWRRDIGTGSDSETQLLAQPVIANGRVYTLDTKAEVRAFDAQNGDEHWRVSLRPDEDDEGTLGGGIAVFGGRLFVTTGFATVFALDAKSGNVIWRHDAPGPVRGGPTVDDGRVFYISVANELVALRASDGRRLWSHSGIFEAASLVGGAEPAVAGGVVIAPYRSGEIVALKVENGRVVWSDNLAALRRTNPVSALPHIRARPVIDRGRVFVIGHSGRMVAINLRTGVRVWEKPVGGTQAPWVAGDLVFVVSLDAELIAMSRSTGAVRWIVQLSRYEDPTDVEEGRVFWAGPVLAGNRLILASSHGELWIVHPETGKVLRTLPVSDDVYVSPAVANGTLYLVTDDATLIAYR